MIFISKIHETFSSLDWYDAKVKTYSNGDVELTIYDKSIFTSEKDVKSSKIELKLKTEQWKNNKDKPKIKKQSNYDGVIRDDSLNRSYKLLVDYAIENSSHWKSFITLTFKDDPNICEANKKLANAIRSIKNHFPNFMYLGVPEFQKRGSIHYHLLTNLDVGTKIVPKREMLSLFNKETKTWKHLDYYDLPFWPHGYSSAFDLSLVDDKFSYSAYMTKYFYKDVSNRLFGRKKVLKSNNLSKPHEETYKINEKEFQNYIRYLDKHMEKTKEKHITATTPYALSMTIYNFKDK